MLAGGFITLLIGAVIGIILARMNILGVGG